ncbi:hypothetical protein MSAN_01541200 [Mycena sanguinolenta]|uniref:Protein kinase domain-containing protein n=1 Tax=Mycena sanguinolenta TaxID=230812 RepID=A0A8H7CZC5_9AGAR|nr:hypothetical protein MSAN_01541200 [Mycena sanguinolenta]
MDDHSQPEPELTCLSACEPESHSSGMFSHSRQFTVMGGTFTNVTKNYAATPSLPSDFRIIPMGDIDLRQEIRVNKLTCSVGYSQLQRGRVRRMHSAKAIIAGQKSRVTVAIYQGSSAEEEWRQDIAKHMSLRHPNIIQICGAASSNGIFATLFNDDLMPLQEIVDRHRDCHFLTVYIYAHCVRTSPPPALHLTCHKNQDFVDALSYLNSAFQRIHSPLDCTKWIRHSTGRLCLCTALTPAYDGLWLDLSPPESPALARRYSLSPGAETIRTFLDSLTLEHYHEICHWNLAQPQSFTLSADTTVKLGVVLRSSGDLLQDSVQIAFLPSVETRIVRNWTISGEGTGEVMTNGWTRFRSGGVFNRSFHFSLFVNRGLFSWLSQANYIFRCLRIVSDLEDYVSLDEFAFELYISETAEDPPNGFLFLCPLEDFGLGSSSFCCPACPAYWSLDPSGIDRLSPEDAMRLGFPSFELTTIAEGSYWDSSVYEGLRRFHEAKGFDPYTQDVARHLGHSLYQLFSERNVPWTYDGEHLNADIDSDCHSCIEDYESEYSPSSARDDPDMPNILLQLFPFIVDAMASHSEEDVHNSAGANCRSENTDISDYEGHDASESTTGAPQAHEIPMVQKDIPEPTLSWSLKCLMATQLALILFLALSWVYNHISVSFSLVL